MAINHCPAALLTSIINMAEALGLSIVAEGVEAPEQLGALASANCRLAQGFYLGRPQRAEQLDELVLSTRRHDQQSTPAHR